MKKTSLALIVAAMAAVLVPVGPQAQEDAGFQVIVHADNPAASIERSRLSKMFLKRIRSWEADDTAVAPIDQSEKSEVRERFTRAVHRKSISAIKTYWQRMIFSGREVPPEEVASDAEMLEKVAADPGAVGYVSPNAPLGDGVKVLEVTE